MLRTHSIAPVRIDLAGGTLDIWPIYLFTQPAITVNLAINLFAEVTIELNNKDTPGILLESLDQKTKIFLSWNELESKKLPPSLSLHQKLLQHFIEDHPKKKSRIKIQTSAKSPPGAGLGGSSALNIALCGALNHLFNKNKTPTLIQIARDVETQVLEVPAGLQDYFSAAYGGLQKLSWEVGKYKNTQLDKNILKELESRLLLFYSGKSRNSGVNNWTLFKEYMDGNIRVKALLNDISLCAYDVYQALLEKDWKNVVFSIKREWTNRKNLCSTISTHEIDLAFSKISKLASLAFKICGAGGGGCFFVLLPDQDLELKNKIIQSIAHGSIQHLPFKAVEDGLKVRNIR